MEIMINVQNGKKKDGSWQQLQQIHIAIFFFTNIQYMRYITKGNIEDQQCCVAYTAIFPIGRQR